MPPHLRGEVALYTCKGSLVIHKLAGTMSGMSGWVCCHCTSGGTENCKKKGKKQVAVGRKGKDSPAGILRWCMKG
jgi:hypothetical protein